MPKLDDVKKNLLDMSPDELREKIREIRADRRISKEPKKVQKTKVRQQDSAKTRMNKLLEKLSPEERREFLEAMGVEDGTEGS